MQNAVIQEDIVDLSLSDEETVVNDTVKLLARVTAQIEPDEPPEALPARVREMMRKIVDTEWKFSNMERGADKTGYERVELVASARVPERENHDLSGRAARASSRGLQVNQIEADTSIPAFMIEDAKKSLRVKIARKAVEEAEALGEALHVEFRVHRLSFTANGSGGGHKALRVMSASASASYGNPDDDGVLGNAQKVTMTASVTLARLVETTPPTFA